MSIRCYVVIGSTSLYPLLPLTGEYLTVRAQQRALNGQMMTAHRATKWKTTLDFTDLDETQRAALVSAASLTASVTYVDEDGTSRTMVVQRITRDLVRTAPSTEGGAATTGPGYYDMSVEMEEV